MHQIRATGFRHEPSPRPDDYAYPHGGSQGRPATAKVRTTSPVVNKWVNLTSMPSSASPIRVAHPHVAKPVILQRFIG